MNSSQSGKTMTSLQLNPLFGVFENLNYIKKKRKIIIIIIMKGRLLVDLIGVKFHYGNH